MICTVRRAGCVAPLYNGSHAGTRQIRRKRRDLVQDIHVELWRSLKLFDGRCTCRPGHTGLRTTSPRPTSAAVCVKRSNWSNWMRSKLSRSSSMAKRKRNRDLLSRLLERIRCLKPLDRQVMLLYLEGETAAAVSEIAGLSASNVATKIHRGRKALGRIPVKRGPHGGQ